MKIFHFVLLLCWVNISYGQTKSVIVNYQHNVDTIRENYTQSGKSYRSIVLSKNQIEIHNSSTLEIMERFALTHEFANENLLDLRFRNIEQLEFTSNSEIGITEVDLSNNPIKTFPEGLNKFNSLQVLKFTNNKFSYLSEDISELRELRILELGNVPVKALPGSFSGLKKLEKLVISYLSIEDKSHFFEILSKLPNLRELELWSLGSEKQFPDSFFKLARLEKLYLSGGDFDLSQVFQKKSIKDLTLRLIDLDTLHDGISQMRDLHSLKIIGSAEIESVSPKLAKLKKLKTLAIDYGWGGTYHVMDHNELYKTIAKLKRLECLQLGDYFEEMYPFYKNKRLKYFAGNGRSKNITEKELSRVKQEIEVDVKGCYQWDDFNPKIKCTGTIRCN